MKALQQVSYEYWAVKVMSQTCRNCLCLINSSVQITMSNQRKIGKLKKFNGNKTFMEAHQIELMTVLMNRFSMICTRTYAVINLVLFLDLIRGQRRKRLDCLTF